MGSTCFHVPVFLPFRLKQLLECVTFYFARSCSTSLHLFLSCSSLRYFMVWDTFSPIDGQRVYGPECVWRGELHLAECPHIAEWPRQQHRRTMLQCPLPQHSPRRAAIWWCAHSAGRQFHPLAGECSRGEAKAESTQGPRKGKQTCAILCLHLRADLEYWKYGVDIGWGAAVGQGRNGALLSFKVGGIATYVYELCERSLYCFAIRFLANSRHCQGTTEMGEWNGIASSQREGTSCTHGTSETKGRVWCANSVCCVYDWVSVNSDFKWNRMDWLQHHYRDCVEFYVVFPHYRQVGNQQWPINISLCFEFIVLLALPAASGSRAVPWC